MFTVKSMHQHQYTHIFRGLLFVLLLCITSLLVAVPASGAPMAQDTPTATPVASVPITPTVSARCDGCITWPNSNKRLDVAHADNVDLDEVRFKRLNDIPLVLYFRVADNGNLLPYQELEYNWDKSCDGGHSILLSKGQAAFIASYNPSFFDGTVIDSATQYRQFMPFLQANIHTMLIGSYTSSTTCRAGSTNPFTENYYPSNGVDCNRLTPQGATNMETRPWFPQACPAQPAKWYIDVANGGVRARFQDNLIQSVKAIEPKPPFVFLDDAIYFEPEFVWKTGERGVDCRERASATLPDCSKYAYRLQKQLGRGIYFDDFIAHYRLLIARLEQEKIRAVLNVVTPPAVIGYERDTPKYAQQFEDLIGQNGVAFEYPFHINLRTNFTDTLHEIELHQRLLEDRKLVIFSADYAKENASTWMAGMAMLIREPGQSLLVARDAYTLTNWIDWPDEYGLPEAMTTPQQKQIGNQKIMGHQWYWHRQFQNGEIIAVHFGVSLHQAKTFTMTLLVPALITETYDVIYPPQLGVLDPVNWVYTATHRSNSNGAVEADYFILGTQCDSERKFCRKLIAVSVGVFK